MHPRRERTSLRVRREIRLVFGRVVGSGFDVQKRSERRGDHSRSPASPLSPNTGNELFSLACVCSAAALKDNTRYL